MKPSKLYLRTMLAVSVLLLAAPMTGLAQFAAAWEPVGNPTGTVWCATSSGASLYAGGQNGVITADPATGVAVWNGISWDPVGNNLSGVVMNLLTFRDTLIAIGNLTDSLSYVGGVKRLIDGSWSDLVGTSGTYPGYCSAALVWKDTLYAAAVSFYGPNPFFGVGKWDGQDWSPVGQISNGAPLSLAVYNDELYLGTAGHSTGTISYRVLRWSGVEWQPVTGSDGITLVGKEAEYIKSLVEFDGKLYACGSTYMGTLGNGRSTIVRWDGDRWESADFDLTAPFSTQALAVYKGKLYAAGQSQDAKRFICRLDGSSWTPVAKPDNQVIGLVLWDDGLLAVGGFTNLGGVSVDHTALWRGCCVASRGNVDMSGIVDSGDLAALVSYLTGGGYAVTCFDAANVNGSGITDSGDLAGLVSYLTGGGFTPSTCP